MIHFEQYNDFITRLYKYENLDIHKTRTITFQVTDDCCFNCSYCYQGHKGHRLMTKEIAKKGVDLLFTLYDKNDPDAYINHNTVGLILEFIGGEPFMNIEIIDYICTYFMNECFKRNHPWLYTFRISITSNGALYFNPKVQDFIKKFNNFLGFSVTIDGPKEIHDACRKDLKGQGTFEQAYAALKHFKNNYNTDIGTKVTIAPENLYNLNTIIQFFINENIKVIHANPIFEHQWTLLEGKQYYYELKQMANYLLENNIDAYISLFKENDFHLMPETDNQNWCGGTGLMLAFDPDGIAYPCLRYMPSSLGNEVKPLIIGDVDGIYQTNESLKLKQDLKKITRQSQSTQECLDCPISSGCGWCSAWNYQLYGTPNKRCTYICSMHKARSLANVYYWNKYYKKNNIDKHFKMHLPKDEALKFISEDEYNILLQLSIS